MESEREGGGSARPRVDVQSLNTRGYLDHTVVPILLDAMAAVAKERWGSIVTVNPSSCFTN